MFPKCDIFLWRSVISLLFCCEAKAFPNPMHVSGTDTVMSHYPEFREIYRFCFVFFEIFICVSHLKN